MSRQQPVKCYYCGEMFTRVEGNYVAIKNRYAHKSCADAQQSNRIIIDMIHSKMRILCGATYNKTKIDRQIQALVKSGKTEVGILRTLDYWYDEKGNNAKDANGGIGIVEWVYGEALEYWDRKNKNNERYKNVDIKEVLKTEEKTYQVKPSKFQKPKKLKLFELN
jgi:hypothetical protein